MTVTPTAAALRRLRMRKYVGRAQASSLRTGQDLACLAALRNRTLLDRDDRLASQAVEQEQVLGDLGEQRTDADDLRALQEVLQRRMQRYLDGDEKFAPLPDLLLMDGGQLQAEAACHVLERLGLTVPVLGMVKDDRHRTRALVTPQGQELGIQQSPPLFALVGRVQEEVHRFAITYHHEKHTKSALTSRLDGIPGVGDVRKKALLKHFRSVRAIEQAELLQLEAVLPKAAARAVYDHFHKEETP